MNKTIIVFEALFLLLFISGCGKDEPPVPHEGKSSAVNAPVFLAAKAESVLTERPDVTKESALAYLQKFSAAVSNEALLPDEGLTTVSYHTGVSHSAGGIMVNGSRSKDATAPPDKSYFHEFHYDSEGKLSSIVENNSGVRSLTNHFYYDGSNPMARLSFVNGVYVYVDLAVYLDGKMFYKCRISPDGELISGALVSQ